MEKIKTNEKIQNLKRTNTHTSLSLLICSLVIICLFYVVRTFVTYEQFGPIYIALFSVIPAVAVTMSILLIKSQLHTTVTRTFIWLVMALSFLFIAEQIWTVYEYFLKEDPFPSIADVFYVSSYPFFTIFLIEYLKPIKKYITKRIIGFAVILSSVFILPVLMTTYNLNTESDIFEFIMALAYPIADIILLIPSIIGILFLFKGERNYFWGAILIGISSTISADIIFTFLDSTNSYQGGNPVEILWLSGYVFWAFACYEYKKNTSITKNQTNNVQIVNTIDYTTIRKLVIPMTVGVIILVVIIAMINLGRVITVHNEDAQAFAYMTYLIIGIIGVFLAIMTVVYKNLENLVQLKTKELQESKQLIENQYRRLQQIEKDKGEFIAMVSHELKSPLVPIKGYVELLLSEKLGKLEEKQKDRLKIIDKSGDTLLKLISDLMDSQKIELGQLTLNKEKSNLGTIITQTVEKLKQSLSEKSVSMTLNLKNNVNVYVDRVRIEQVLQNIILNAVDFLPKNDGKLEILLTSDSDYGIVSIKDNGIGIPKDKIDNLFDRFYQINSGFTRKHGGSGLGLAICKAIIENHDGMIDVHSEGEGKGATFSFRLPLKKD